MFIDVCHDKIHLDSDKVLAIHKANHPTAKTQLRLFLGLVNFFGKFISISAQIAFTLTDVTRKFSPGKRQWSESQEKAFQNVKVLNL